MSTIGRSASRHLSLAVGALCTSLLLGPGWGCKSDGLPSGSGQATEVPDLPIALPVHPELVTGQLRNGFSYFLRPVNNTGNSLMLALAVRVGSLAEADEERGFAHFVEHVAFDDDQRFSGVAPLELLQRVGSVFGADSNAQTSAFSTVYFLNLPQVNARLLEQGLSIARGWAGDVRFDAIAVDRQRANLLSEQRAAQDERKSVGGLFAQRVDAGTRVAEREPGGVPTVVQAATPAQLASFYRRWYRPQQMALVAVGELDTAEMVLRLEQQFANLPDAGAARQPPAVDLPPSSDEWHLSEASDWGEVSSSVRLLWRLPAPAQGSEQTYRSGIVDLCLCNILEARLRRSSRSPDASFELPACSTMLVGDGRRRILSLRIAARAGQLRNATAAVLVELERARQHGFLASELERARASLLATSREAIQRRSSSAASAELQRLSQHFLFGSPFLSEEQELDLSDRLLRGIDLSTLQQRSRQWWEQGLRSVDVLRANDSSLASSANLAELLQSVRGRPLEPPAEAAPVPPLMSQLPAPVRAPRSERIEELQLRVWALPNGAKVAFRPGRENTGQVLVRGISPGGGELASEAERWSARVAATLVSDSGVAEHDYQTLREILDGTQVRAEPWLDEISEGIRGAAPTTSLEPLFQLLHLYFTQPRHDPAALDALKERLQRPLTPERLFEHAIAKAIYGAEPRRTGAARDHVEELQLGRALDFYRDRFGNVSDFHFVVVGDVTEGELLPLVERYLSSLPGSPRQDEASLAPVQIARGVQHVRVPGRLGQQSRVVLDFPRHGTYSPEAAVDLAALASYLQLRLRDVLREELGGVYSVAVSQWWLPGEARLRVQFECRPEDVDTLRSATLGVIAELEVGASESHLEIVRAQRNKQVNVAMKSDDFWVDELEQAFRAGRDPRKLLEQPGLTARITRQQLRDAARRHLSSRDYVDAVWSAQ